MREKQGEDNGGAKGRMRGEERKVWTRRGSGGYGERKRRREGEEMRRAWERKHRWKEGEEKRRGEEEMMKRWRKEEREKKRRRGVGVSSR